MFVCWGNICRSPMAQVVAEAHAAREGLTGITFGMAGVSAEWDALPPAEKQSYESRARKDVANYRAALAKYVASEAPVSRDAASL